MDIDKIIREFPKGLLNWYQFLKGGNVLLITGSVYTLEQQTALREVLEEKCGEVICINPEFKQKQYDQEWEDFLNRNQSTFDYVVLVDVLEEVSDPAEYLLSVKALLKKDGRLLIGAENRLGLKYFCGDRDPYTGRSFDGVEHYFRISANGRKFLRGRCYSRDELKGFLVAAGFEKHKFYSVLPELKMPQLIYSEDYMPKEELAIRCFPMYNYPDSVFLEEEHLYTDLVKNGMFHAMANSYLIECPMEGKPADVLHVTLSLDRGPDNAMATIIREEEGRRIVEKNVLYPEGVSKLEAMQEKAEYLRKHGINVVSAEIEGDSYRMLYVDGVIAMNYIRELAKKDKDAFICEMDDFRGLILKSSEHLEENENGVILERAYLDLVPLNCFYINDEYIFYDQEFYEEKYPVNVIIFRMVDIIYMGDQELEGILPIKFFWDRYGLSEKLKYWQREASDFTTKLRNQKELHIFNEAHQRNGQNVYYNRLRMNYSDEEYRRIFADILKDTESKDIVLFGSGRYARRFLVQFKNECTVSAAVDNNLDKWGTMLERGEDAPIEIQSPQILEKMDKSRLKVIICIKNFMGIIQQLEEMGVRDYGIYDVNTEYPRKNNNSNDKNCNVKEGDNNGNGANNCVKKPYHVGYLAGVFDLFHIGHLNLFKRAKEQCDYLIVGVVSDEGVRINKRTDPYVPFVERIEMVRSCKYVDEAVEIPFGSGGTKDAWNMYHFDCQFSGSDYVNDPSWLAEKQFLEKHGAELVFFPYTESTSSTKIKKMIDKALL